MKPDWADKAADRFYQTWGDLGLATAENNLAALTRALRAAERRGAKRERERCALIVERELDGGTGDYVAMQIRKASK